MQYWCGVERRAGLREPVLAWGGRGSGRRGAGILWLQQGSRPFLIRASLGPRETAWEMGLGDGGGGV